MDLLEVHLVIMGREEQAVAEVEEIIRRMVVVGRSASKGSL
jgi:hypothetical protein